MDCSVKPTKYPDMFLISTTDFFYPLVDDPYMQGKIGCANVLSDQYAMGVVDCDNLLMLLAVSNQMEDRDRDICTSLIVKGFNDAATEANTQVTGGQTVINPWPIIGGVAMSMQKESDFIRPENAVPGDVLILTKPLGTQVSVNLHQWIDMPEKWARIAHLTTVEKAIAAYEFAIDSMARLNRNAARLMHKYKAHAATDVTGFGLLGHSNNLCKNQKQAVDFVIHTLPIIEGMKEIAQVCTFFNLLQGRSAETSGGLLIAMEKNEAIRYCEELEQLDGYQAWIIGDVVSSDRPREMNRAFFIENPTIISVPAIPRLH
jgi:selenide,water dikinase